MDFLLLCSISIHRPHTRPDLQRKTMYNKSVDFNSQASYEARLDVYKKWDNFTVFQFTGLIRGPTNLRLDAAGQPANFNSQASYEARLCTLQRISRATHFNSQASYEARRANANIISIAG